MKINDLGHYGDLASISKISEYSEIMGILEYVVTQKNSEISV